MASAKRSGRGLKHRPAQASRTVPIPPELVGILSEHIAVFGISDDGRVFSSERGQVVASTAISDVRAAARRLALTPEQYSSPLAGRPYDLRHAAVSLWLNSGVPAPDVAERTGHSVEVLLRIYAKCLDEGQAVANKRIDAVLQIHGSTRRWAGCHPTNIPRVSARASALQRLAA